MKQLKFLFVSLVFALAACSSGPSDSDVSKAIEFQMHEQLFPRIETFFGKNSMNDASEFFKNHTELVVTIKNKSKDGDRWKVDGVVMFKIKDAEKLIKESDFKSKDEWKQAVEQAKNEMAKNELEMPFTAVLLKGDNGWTIVDMR